MTETDFGFVVGAFVGFGVTFSLSPVPAADHMTDGALLIYLGVMVFQIVATVACLADMYVRSKR